LKVRYFLKTNILRKYAIIKQLAATLKKHYKQQQSWKATETRLKWEKMSGKNILGGLFTWKRN